MAPTADALCPRCQGPGNPSNFGATCDECRTALRLRNLRPELTEQRTIDLRAEADTPVVTL